MTGIVEHVVGGPRPEEVMRETWGHLDAKPGVEHPGTILFAGGAFGGERIILRSEFGDAGYGPWFYRGIHDWLCEQEIEDGKIYEFTGFYMLEGDAHVFDGEIVEKELR